MPIQGSGRVHKYLVDVGAAPPEGRTLDKLQLFLPDGTALDLENLGGEEAPPAFVPFGPWVAGSYDPGSVVTHNGITYFATEATTGDDEPGITGAPVVEGLSAQWAEVGVNQFDTADGEQWDGSPIASHADSTLLYLPFLTSGHVTLALDTFDDHYVSYASYDSDFTLQGTGSGDSSIGMDVTAEEWYWLLYHDPGFDAGHDPGPVSATLSLSGGATMSPPPEANPWVAFAAAP